MLRNHFIYANQTQNVPLMEHQDQVMAYQGEFDPKRIHIINPDDGRPLRLARPNEGPNLLGMFSLTEGRWKYYKDAVILYNHPNHGLNRNLVGMYVQANMDLSDLFDKQAKSMECDFLTRRNAQIKADRYRMVNRASIPNHGNAVPERGDNIVLLFPSPEN